MSLKSSNSQSTGNKDLAALENQLIEVCQEIYRRGQRRIIPRYPWVLVRVVPKEQRSGQLILTESQNKIIYEGIVLETWQPFKRVFSATVKSKLYPEYQLEGEQMKSSYKVGDRICFPHYEGMPVPYLDYTSPNGSTKADNAYRLVREETIDIKCGVFGSMYYQADEGLAKKLNELFSHVHPMTISGK